jgi:hypothetical protein
MLILLPVCWLSPFLATVAVLAATLNAILSSRRSSFSLSGPTTAAAAAVLVFVAAGPETTFRGEAAPVRTVFIHTAVFVNVLVVVFIILVTFLAVPILPVECGIGSAASVFSGCSLSAAGHCCCSLSLRTGATGAVGQGCCITCCCCCCLASSRVGMVWLAGLLLEEVHFNVSGRQSDVIT